MDTDYTTDGVVSVPRAASVATAVAANPSSGSAPDLFASRRSQFVDRMVRHAASHPGAAPIAIVSGGDLLLRNGDVHFGFRQSSDAFYLTGFEEPGAIAVFTPYRDDAQFTLFVPPRDPSREVWDGPRAGVQGAVDDFGADAAFPLEEFGTELERLIDGASALFYHLGDDPRRDALVLAAMRRHRTKPREPLVGPDTLIDTAALLDDMRWIKSAEEIDRIRRACRISAQGHREAMRAAAPGLYEYQVQAVLEYSFRVHGSPRNGYGSIVASGANSTVLHYVSNQRQMQANELLLIDAGAEFDYYTADITRTFPVSGRFTGAQRDAYQVVLDAQHKAIAMATSGRTARDVHDTAVRALTEGMVDLGLLQGDVDGLIETEAYKAYYMHRTGHWLGMDVHDVGCYLRDRQPRPLEPGVVLTVEPGLYVAVDALDAPEAFRGVGIRIEDDILVTKGAPINLTADVPTDPDEVEALCREESRFSALLPLPRG